MNVRKPEASAGAGAFEGSRIGAVLAAATAMVGLYLLLVVPSGWLMLVSFPPGRSNDEPPGVAFVIYALLVLVPFAVSRLISRRVAGLRAAQMLLAAGLASSVLGLLWELRLVAGGSAFDAARVLIGAMTLLVLMGPAAWIGVWKRAQTRG
jgi:uncharacterized RDD family membrane protein YckC